MPLSGGLDSTYLLYKIATEYPEYDLYVFHLSLIKGYENYHQEEKIACNRIIQWFHDKMPGRIKWYHNPKLDLRGMHCGLDTDGVLVVAQKVLYKIVKQKKYEDVKLGIGLVADDGNYARFRNQWMGEGMNTRLWGCLLDSMVKRVNLRYLNMVDRQVQFPLYHEDIDKKRIVELMPEELLNHVWVCRRPRNGKHCKECGSCKTHMKALEEANR